MKSKEFINFEISKVGNANGLSTQLGELIKRGEIRSLNEKEKNQIINEAAFHYGEFLKALGCDYENDPNSADTTAEVIKTEERGFNMTNYTITNDNGITKISASAKSEVNEVITKALADAFGSENVAMVRTSGSSPVNCLAIRVGTLTDESGFEHDLCVTVDTTVKSYKDRVTKRYTIEAFDFETAIACYENYLAEKATLS